ncbi:MAG: lipopolysaccharide biosynthesis protein [Nitrosospira sp.]
MGGNYSRAAFRRSIIQYTSGRLLNALAAFLIFVWIARQLPEQQYANYIAAFALMEIGLIVSGFGMEWVTAVFIPQAKLKAAGSIFNKFVWQCVAVQATTLLIGACLLFMFAPMLDKWFRLENAAVEVFKIYAVVMFVEGVSRVFRDQLLSCLLLQAAAQMSAMARNIIMLISVFWIFQNDEWRTAEGLGFAEICASSGSLLIAAVFLYRHLMASRNDPASEPSWRLPHWVEMLRAGRNAWLSNLANLSWGPQMVILLASRVSGSETTALLGFSRNLSEQVRKLMPMDFLLGIIRTLLIARFSEDGNRQKLGTRAGLIFKANLLFLLPLLVVVIVRGEEICSLLSGGRYGAAHWFLVGWLSVLVFWAHHRLTDVLAHALGRSGLTSRASILLSVTPLLLLVVVEAQHWALVFLVLMLAEIAYSYMVLVRLKTPQWGYHMDRNGLAKFGLAALLTSGIVAAIPKDAGITAALLATGMAFVTMWMGVLFSRAWSPEEEAMLPEKIRRWPLIRRKK